jgi:hypothetical protein
MKINRHAQKPDRQHSIGHGLQKIPDMEGFCATLRRMARWPK